MSWLSGIVGKAEDLLNQVDQTAAVALQKNESSSRTGTNSINSSGVLQHSHLSSVNNSYQTTSHYGTTEHAKSYSPPSIPTTKSSPVMLKSSRTRSSTIEKNDEKLIEYLNSSETAFIPRKNPTSPKRNPSTPKKSKQEDTEAFPNPCRAEVSNNTGEKLTDVPLLVEEKSKLSAKPSIPEETENNTIMQAKCSSKESLNAEPSTANASEEDKDLLANEENKSIQQNSSNTALQEENHLLRNEIKLLNEEIENVTRKNKDLESDMKRLQRKLEHWNSQVSGSDHLIRDLQERETDLSNALNAKDSQLAVLRVRLQEADQELQVKRTLVEQLRSENERLKQDQNDSFGIHSQTVESLKEKLRETGTALQREKAAYKSLQTENMERLSRLEDEQKKLVETLTSTQKALSEEKAQNKDLSGQIKLAATNLVSLKQEFSEYKQKAQRILQSKEKVISSLKEAQTGNQEAENLENMPVANAEVEVLQQECETLREELHKSSKHVENLQLEIQEMERMSQSDMENCREQIRVLEEQFKNEQQHRISLEQECSQQREELRFCHEDLARAKSSLQSRIQDRDSEIDKLRKQLTTKSLSSTSQSELEARLHSLTESLIQKQTVVEALSTEKNSLVLQLERLEQQLRDSNASGSHRQNTIVGIGGSENASLSERYRSSGGYFVLSPYDGPIARKMKRVYGIIDSFSIRSGVFLRRYPMARIFVIVYMILLHLWVTIVLLTYKPEVHGPHYNLERT